MEEFYREIYAVDGITEIKFPEHFPISRLLECVEVVGCVQGEELACWNEVPEGVRLEAQTDYCWLCKQPQIYEAAARGLTKVESPLLVKFPLPNPRDLFSLKPGSLFLHVSESKQSELWISSNLSAAIAGVRAAATQFSKNQNHTTSFLTRTSVMNIDTLQKVEMASSDLEEASDDSAPRGNENEFSSYNQASMRERKQHAGPSSKVRLEAQTDYCWLCEQPQKLVIPFEMRGYQKIYNLEKKIYEAAARGLTKVESPLPVKFPLPNPRDLFSLKPGSLLVHVSESNKVNRGYHQVSVPP